MFKLVTAIAILLGYLHAVVGAAHAATVVTQVPCVDAPDDWCVSFGPSGTVPIIRSVRLNADARGRAIVTFHGSVACLNSSGFKGEVELVSQIVDNPNANPDPTLPSGLYHIATLPPDGRATFNLASTRVFTVPAAGAFTYRFKIGRLGLSPTDAECRVYNAVFTIEFKP